MAEPAALPGGRSWKTIFVLVSGATIGTFIAQGLLSPALPLYLTGPLGTTKATAGLVVSSMSLAAVLVRPFAGAFVDRYGRRPVLLSGLGLFLIGSAISLAAETATLLVLGRLVQAIGAGCGLTLVRAIARDAFRAEQLVKAIAYLTMFGTLGPMVSPFIGGVLIDTFGWRSVFGFALIAAGAAGLTLSFALPQSRAAQAKGAATLSPFIQLGAR